MYIYNNVVKTNKLLLSMQTTTNISAGKPKHSFIIPSQYHSLLVAGGRGGGRRYGYL